MADFKPTYWHTHERVLPFISTRYSIWKATPHSTGSIDSTQDAALWRVISRDPKKSGYGEWLMEQLQKINAGEPQDERFFPADKYKPDYMRELAGHYMQVLERNAKTPDIDPGPSPEEPVRRRSIVPQVPLKRDPK